MKKFGMYVCTFFLLLNGAIGASSFQMPYEPAIIATKEAIDPKVLIEAYARRSTQSVFYLGKCLSVLDAYFLFPQMTRLVQGIYDITLQHRRFFESFLQKTPEEKKKEKAKVDSIIAHANDINVLIEKQLIPATKKSILSIIQRLSDRDAAFARRDALALQMAIDAFAEQKNKILKKCDEVPVSFQADVKKLILWALNYEEEILAYAVLNLIEWYRAGHSNEGEKWKNFIQNSFLLKGTRLKIEAIKTLIKTIDAALTAPNFEYDKAKNNFDKILNENKDLLMSQADVFIDEQNKLKIPKTLKLYQLFYSDMCNQLYVFLNMFLANAMQQK